MVDVIALERVTYSVGDRSLVHAFSYAWQPGNTYALLGVSGSGKSTLLHLLAGFQLPTSGTIWYGSRAHHLLSDEDRRGLRLHTLSYVTQNAALIPELTVLENVMVCGLIEGKSRSACQEYAYDLLTRVDLAERALAYPRMLSGGEQQRAALARALWNRPAWVLLDEPTAHLDRDSKQRVVSILLEMHACAGMGIIMATHDDAVARSMQHTVYIQDGTLTHAGA